MFSAEVVKNDFSLETINDKRGFQTRFCTVAFAAREREDCITIVVQRAMFPWQENRVSFNLFDASGISGSWETQGRTPVSGWSGAMKEKTPNKASLGALLFLGPHASGSAESSFQGQVQDTTSVMGAAAEAQPRPPKRLGNDPAWLWKQAWRLGAIRISSPGFMGIASRY